jgi:hypothetical protein
MRTLPQALIVIILSFVCSLAKAQQLQCYPCNVGFNQVTIGTSKTAYVRLTNVGKKWLRIGSKSKTGAAFSFGKFNLPVPLAPGSSVRLPLIFTPHTVGWTTGSATLISNALNKSLTIKLSGTGGTLAGSTAKLTLTPSGVNFGNIVVGTYKKLQVTVSASNGSVTISSLNLSSSEFSVLGLALPLTLASGHSAQMTIEFKPNSSGQASGKLILDSKAANSPTTELLSGTGVAASAHSVYLSWRSDLNPVVGYNVYRGTQSGGPFERVNSALEASTNYTDYSVKAGATYFYAATAVSAQGRESSYSSKIKVSIPYP